MMICSTYDPSADDLTGWIFEDVELFFPIIYCLQMRMM